MAEIEKVPVTQTGDEGKDLSQDIKKERTPEEIATYNLKKKAEDAKAMGLDPKKILGEESIDDEPPAWYRKEKSKEATITALQLADSIQDEDTKEKVKQYLNTRIVPSGNSDQDFKDALGAVSASKNKLVLEEMGRYTKPKTTAAGGTLPANMEEEFTPTDAEKVMMAKPYNLSKEKVLEARRKVQQ